jgi:ethanolamine utilization protein EutQ (cupin superfamily)
MPELIDGPSRVQAAGTKPKLIDEFVGRVNTRETRVSVARMQSPEDWVEPGQRPDFDEWTVVLEGALHVEHERGTLAVRAGQAAPVRAGA